MGFFSKEEENKLSSQFWQDNMTRRITATKEWKPSKTNPDQQLCYIAAYDVDTKKGMSFLDFNFLKALKELPDGKYDGAILKVTPKKVGERDYMGKKYDQFEYEMAVTGEFAEVVPDVSSTPF
jgi:hypothetical protein